MSTPTTEEQISTVQQRLLDPNISDEEIEKAKKILEVLREQD